MDLQQIKKKISENKYELRRQFLYDIKLIMDNSILYNGGGHPITITAKNVSLLHLLKLKCFLFFPLLFPNI